MPQGIEVHTTTVNLPPDLPSAALAASLARVEEFVGDVFALTFWPRAYNDFRNMAASCTATSLLRNTGDISGCIKCRLNLTRFETHVETVSA